MLKVDEYKHQAETCVRCSYCKFPDLNYIKSSRFSRQCPIDMRYRFNLYSAHGLLHSALAELSGKLEFTPKLVDALWHCTLCGGCDTKCKRNLDVEVLQVIETLRCRCVEQGKGPLPEHKMLADNVKSSHNIYGADPKERLNWLPPDVKLDYPKMMEKSTEDMPYTVLHITEYIDQLMQDGKFKFNRRVPMKVTYHDPCNLGRLAEPWYHWEPKYEPPNIAVGKTWRRGEKGVYEPPRNILKGIRGLELIEMERIWDNAWCCGYGGGVGTAFPDFALWTAGERIEEAKTTGAEAIVSSCPHCKDILGRAADANNTGIKVYDITEVMLRAIR